MSQEKKQKTRMARECLWLIFSIIGSSLFWYFVAYVFPAFWESLKISLSRLWFPSEGGLIQSRLGMIAYLDVLTIMFVYILRFTSWAKILVKRSMERHS